MGTETGIQWTSHTFNPWRGCTKVSAGCDHCYADTLSKRNPAVLGVWGQDGARAIAAESYWRQPLAWNAAAEKASDRRRVFCASLADVFEGRDTMPKSSWGPVEEARKRLWNLIYETQNLDWQLLTKRPENAYELIGGKSGAGFSFLENEMRNCWIGTSCENQETADKRIPELLKIPAAVRFLSGEPLLGPVDLTGIGQSNPTEYPLYDCLLGKESPGAVFRAAKVDWVIVGGESGSHARPMHPDWARSIRDQCQAAGVPHFFKQWGEWIPENQVEAAPGPINGPMHSFHGANFIGVGKKSAGRILDGREWSEFPTARAGVAHV